MRRVSFIILALICLILGLTEGSPLITLLGVIGFLLGLDKAGIINIKEELSKPD